MGHIRLGTLPKTREWREVIGLLNVGASVPAIIAGATVAAHNGLELARNDPGVVSAVWWLTQLPLAAREGDLAEALRRRGLDLGAQPTLLEITAALVDGLDREGRQTKRSDLAEIAHLSVSETITALVGPRLPSLFSASTSDVRAAVAEFGTEKQFGLLARTFFARFTERYLSYYLSRELSLHVGRGSMPTIDSHTAFNSALKQHCFEAAKIVETFAGAWRSKTEWEKGEISRDAARGFTAIAIRKLDSELRRREDDRVHQR